MQRSIEMTLEQQAYHVVMHWLVAVPRSSRFRHMPQWTLGNQAYQYLAISTAAWSPSRRAAVDVAMRLFMVQLRADHRELTDEAATLERRIYRAVQLTGLPVNPRDQTENWVRLVAYEYQLERTISACARHDFDGRPFTREAANRLFRATREALRPDDDSGSDSSEAGMEEEG